jgi:hypothetical protein
MHPLMTEIRRTKSTLDAQESLISIAEAEVLAADREVEAQQLRVEQSIAAKLSAAEAYVSGKLSRTELSAEQAKCHEAAHELESLGDLLAGFVAKRARIRDAMQAARADYCSAASRLASLVALRTEAHALASYRATCDAFRLRHALAKLAQRLESEARGVHCEPVPVANASEAMREMPAFRWNQGLSENFLATGIQEFQESELLHLDLDAEVA